MQTTKQTHTKGPNVKTKGQRATEESRVRGRHKTRKTAFIPTLHKLAPIPLVILTKRDKCGKGARVQSTASGASLSHAERRRAHLDAEPMAGRRLAHDHERELHHLEHGA